MSKRKYPRIGNVWKQHDGGLCYACGENKAESRIDLEWSYMRGDDDVFKAHAKCVPKAKEMITAEYISKTAILQTIGTGEGI